MIGAALNEFSINCDEIDDNWIQGPMRQLTGNVKNMWFGEFLFHKSLPINFGIEMDLEDAYLANEKYRIIAANGTTTKFFENYRGGLFQSRGGLAEYDIHGSIDEGLTQCLNRAFNSLQDSLK